MQKSKISDAPENNFAVSFMHLKLRRGHKEDYMKVGEKSKAGIRLQDINKVVCSFEGGHILEGGSERRHFQRCVNLDAERQWTEPA